MPDPINSTDSIQPAHAQPRDFRLAPEHPCINPPSLHWSDASFPLELAASGSIDPAPGGAYHWHGSASAFGAMLYSNVPLPGSSEPLAPPAEMAPMPTLTTTSLGPALPPAEDLAGLHEADHWRHRPAVHPLARPQTETPARAPLPAEGPVQAPQLAPLLTSPRELPDCEIVLLGTSYVVDGSFEEVAPLAPASAESLQSLLVACELHTPMSQP